MWQPLSVATACVLAVIANGPAQAERPAPPLPSAFDAKWHGQTVCEPLFENAAMRAARCTFPPGGGHERHFHPPHWGYIIAGGTMRITDANGTRVRELKSGSTWWSDGIAWHEALNVGTTTSVYIIVEPKSGQ
jgi:quercetin dioxygenase-like cupin family protein